MRDACNRNHPPAQWLRRTTPRAEQAGAFAMRLTLSLLGHTLDLTLEPTTTDDDPQRDLGTTGHYPVGFVARHDVPEEVSYPQRTPAWDDEDRRR